MFHLCHRKGTTKRLQCRTKTLISHVLSSDIGYFLRLLLRALYLMTDIKRCNPNCSARYLKKITMDSPISTLVVLPRFGPLPDHQESSHECHNLHITYSGIFECIRQLLLWEDLHPTFLHPPTLLVRKNSGSNYITLGTLFQTNTDRFLMISSGIYALFYRKVPSLPS